MTVQDILLYDLNNAFELLGIDENYQSYRGNYKTEVIDAINNKIKDLILDNGNTRKEIKELVESNNTNVVLRKLLVNKLDILKRQYSPNTNLGFYLHKIIL